MREGIGDRPFGPYRLVQQIAVGGMAEIHLAKTHGIAGFEKYVALKMIHPNFSQDQQFIQMLIDEAKITVQLQHVNIAQTFDLGRVEDTFYITMEYVDGADLYRLLRKSSEQGRLFPIPLAAFIGKEVASGLDYAHRKRDHNGQNLGIVHRDVSPQNVLLSYAGEVKLVDFGIAKATMRARQTAVGVIKGKYYYMSPEQAWGEKLDQRTDIFSAGILLYETLTGQMLYLEEDLHKLLEMVRRADIPPPSTVRSEIPPVLDQIVMHALAKRPEDRYQTAGDLANDLERFLHSYAPVFTANKVSGWMHEVLGPAPSPGEQERDVVPEAERDRGHTRRLTRDQLVLARSEFTDENSIIFAFGARDTTGGGRSDALDDTSTVDAAMSGEAEDVDSLPEAPREQAPASRPRLVPMPSAPGSGSSLGGPGPEPADRGRRPDERPGHVELPADRLPGVTPGSDGEARRATPAPDSAARRPPSGSARLQTAPAAPRARDQETRLLKDPVRPPVRASSRADAAIRGDEPTELGDESGAAGLDEATLISAAPSWWSGAAELTEVTAPPFDAGLPPPASADADGEAPTLLKGPSAVTRPPAGWQPAPALAASVSQPAVSQLRPPRGSRRTPRSGLPVARPGSAAIAMDSEPRDDSVLASLLVPGDSRRPPAVALSPATRLAEPSPVPPAVFAPGSSPPSAAPFSTRAMAAALERDEIPDHYKIRGRQPNSWLVGLFVLVLAGAVAGLLFAIYGTGAVSGPPESVLHIISIPPGAAVSVDGQLLPERTPTSIRGTPGKRFLFGFELPRYQREEQEFIVPDQGADHQVVARLDPVVVKLVIESVPSGAEVFIGGNSVGRTPLTLPGLDPQTTSSIELRLKGYRPVRQLLDWTRETDQRQRIELYP